MDAERLKQIEEVYHAAMEIAPAERLSFLDESCGDDEDLRREVESLLAVKRTSNNIFDTPPESLAAEMFSTREKQTSRKDEQIGHYTIRKLLGKGGMGEVYLAEDTRLNRRVALKFLSASISDDKNRLRRFEREALAASALNHPNILTIYEFEAENETPFIVTEFVEGKTLREILNGEGLNLEDILSIAEQTVFALSAAHKAGIIHRDIKPENVILREDRIVKVLDFGLAKLIKSEINEEAGGSRFDSGFGAKPLTLANTNSSGVLGTVAYMSPEQTRGQADIDGRTDIWSLGVVLYEMLTGKTPFSGETTGEVVAAILKSEPAPLRSFIANVPPDLERIVERTLCKDSKERYQNSKDLLVELRDLKSDLDVQSKLKRPAALSATGNVPIKTTRLLPRIDDTAEPGANFTVGEPFSDLAYQKPNSNRRAAPRTALPAVLAASVLLAFGVFYFNKYFSPESQKKILPPAAEPMKQTRLTTLGRISDTAISPDGRYFAYVAKDGGKDAVYVRQTATNDTVNILPADIYYAGLSFSPDGNFIYFISGSDEKTAINDLYRIKTLGGEPVKLISDVDSRVSFAPGGQEFCFRRGMPQIQESGIFIANADGTNERKIASRKLSFSFVSTPVWSPDGKTIASMVKTGIDQGEEYSLIGINLESGEQKPIGQKLWNWHREMVWMPDGSELLLNSQEKTGDPHQLWRVSYPSGEVLNVTNDFNDYQGVSVTADASLVTVKNTLTANLFVAPFEKLENARQLTFVEGVSFYGLSWTPDKRIVYGSNLGGKRDVWIINADGSGQRQLTNDNFSNYDPDVTPDGRYIVYVSNRTGQHNIWRMNLDGSNPVQITGGNEGVGELAPAVTPDSKWIVFDSIGETLWKIPVEGGKPLKLTEPQSHFANVSPDGKSIAFIFWGDVNSPTTFSVVPITGGTPSRNFNITTPGFRWQQQFRWATDSRALIYVDSTPGYSNLIRLPLDNGKRTPITDFKSERIFGFDISLDGKQVVFARGTTTSDALMLDNLR